MKDGWKLLLIVSSFLVCRVVFIGGVVLGNAGDFIQTVRESGVSLTIPSPSHYWNLQFISLVVAVLYASMIIFLLKENW